VYTLTPPSVAGAPWTETVLWNFRFNGTDAFQPYAGVVIGHGEVLYGTTSQGGTSNWGAVFSLVPPATKGSSWKEHILHSFNPVGTNDGATPLAPLVIGSGGTLYGTTQVGGGSGNQGAAFSLVPPISSGGAWTESILYGFSDLAGNLGFNIQAGLLLSKKTGALYGAAYGGGANGSGTLFQLKPPTSPGGTWKFTELYSFTGAEDGGQPNTGLAVANGGILYGTTLSSDVNGGTVFSLKL